MDLNKKSKPEQKTITASKTQCQMHSIFVSSTADAPPGVSGVSKDQKKYAKSDFGYFKR